MTDCDIMFKALKLPWIPKLLRTSHNSNWCIITNRYFRRKGGLNYDDATGYKKIPDFFDELTTLNSYD